MSQLTALALCLGAVAIGFLVASICQAARIEDDASVYWHQGKEYGYRMGVEAERRAVRPVETMKVSEPFVPFDWAHDDRDAVVSDLAPGRYWLTDEGKAALIEAQRDEAKAKHPSSWTEAHADRGPWPA